MSPKEAGVLPEIGSRILGCRQRDEDGGAQTSDMAANAAVYAHGRGGNQRESKA
jgi:hypothetical protein